MDIGDKVRFLHGKEEGVVRKFIDGRTVEVEIEDGFLIPVLKNELVTVHAEESERFGYREKNKPENTYRESSEEETFMEEDEPRLGLAMEFEQDQLQLWLINATPFILHFTVHTQRPDQVKGLTHGVLKKYTYARLDSWSMKDQDRWPLILLDVIRFAPEGKQHLPALSRKFSFNDRLLRKRNFDLPLMNKKGIFLPLDEADHVVDPDKMKEALFSQKEEQTVTKDLRHEAANMVIDLHAEALKLDTNQLDISDIFEEQLNHFLNKLDQAVMQNAHSITFIHGIGNGSLRHAIHKKLSKYPHIRYFEDAQKEKFGYGATKVYLK